MMKLYEDVKTKTFDKVADKCDYDKGFPCLICGKPVKPGANIKMLRLVCDGKFITDNEDDNIGGWCPVCNTCYKRVLKGC